SVAGQSTRWTDSSPVSPAHTTSDMSGSSGAASRIVVSSTVYRVSNASRASRPEDSPAQNRERDRRTYQLVSASAKRRSSSQAAAMSVMSSAAVMASRVAASLARM